MTATTADARAIGTTRLDRETATILLFEEAACLDQNRWKDWLALYCEDAHYWIPSWRNFSETTTDPDTEMSLIYYTERSRLEERIWRITSGLSTASAPLSRTMHTISNVRLDKQEANVAHANFLVQVFNPFLKETVSHFGTYRVHYVQQDAKWLIQAKTIVLLNDYLPSFIDVYTI